MCLEQNISAAWEEKTEFAARVIYVVVGGGKKNILVIDHCFKSALTFSAFNQDWDLSLVLPAASEHMGNFNLY